jgi:hypothetical protein
MGKPVAFEARADERDTRGFISMTTMARRGIDAELMFDLLPHSDLADDGERRQHPLAFVGEGWAGRR